jgi:hypothetical protein
MTVKRIKEIIEWLNKNKKSSTNKIEILKWFIFKEMRIK